MILVGSLLILCGILIFLAWCWCASWWARDPRDLPEMDVFLDRETGEVIYIGSGWDDEYDYDDHLREYARDAHA